MRHSPSVQCSETAQQCHHTLVLAVAAASCELLSESRTSDNHISSSQYSSVPQHQPVTTSTGDNCSDGNAGGTET